jgi:predicted lipoprotein with Yx(FWY)xxD motif
MFRLAAILVLVPSLALAGVTRHRAQPKQVIADRHLGTALAASQVYQIATHDEAVTVTHVTTRITSGAAGTGTFVFRIEDELSNVCTCTANCATTAPKLDAAAVVKVPCSGACSFAPAAQLSLKTTTTVCSSTQPTVTSVTVYGLKR